MTFWKTVGAYLTGWVIARTIFDRIWTFVMRGQYDMTRYDAYQKIAVRVVDEMERLRTGEGYRLNDSQTEVIADRIMDQMVGAHDVASEVSRTELKRACRAAFQSVLDDAGVA